MICRLKWIFGFSNDQFTTVYRKQYVLVFLYALCVVLGYVADTRCDSPDCTASFKLELLAKYMYMKYELRSYIRCTVFVTTSDFLMLEIGG